MSKDWPSNLTELEQNWVEETEWVGQKNLKTVEGKLWASYKKIFKSSSKQETVYIFFH